MEKKQPCSHKNIIIETGWDPYTVYTSPFQYKATNWAIKIVLIVLLLLFIILTITYIVNYSRGRRDGMNPVTIVDDINGPDSNYGSSVKGEVANYGVSLNTEHLCTSNNGAWNRDRETCSCKPPYYGKFCQKESHPPTMYYSDDVKFESIPVKGNVPLTFNESGEVDPESCTSICDKNFSCLGVKHVNGKCSLIISNPEYKEGGETVLLYKDGVRPIDKSGVYVYSGSQNRPLRFWLERDEVNRVALNEVSKITIPVNPRINNDGLHKGIWSQTIFLSEEFDELYSSGNVFVDEGISPNSDYQLSFPPEMIGKTVYVMYVKSNKTKNVVHN